MKQRKFDIVIFDLGTTLLHFTGDFVETNREGVKLMHAFLSSQGIDVDLDELYSKWIELRLKGFEQAEKTMREVTAEDTLRRVLNELGISDPQEDIIQKSIDIFFELEVADYRPYEDTYETLSYLKKRGYTLGLISNATSHIAVAKLVKRYGLADYFDLIYSSAGFGLRKPHPMIFRKMLEELGKDASRGVMIGDSPLHDVHGAHSVGLKAILVHYPNDGPEPEYKPDFQAEELKDVIEFIEKS